MRSEKTRKPERASQGSVARKRYRTVDHCGSYRLGQGWMTGHQKRSPVPRKVACSTACKACECNARVKTAGTCHTTSVAVAASQHTAGWPSALPTRPAVDRG